MPTVKKTIELDQDAINRIKAALNAKTEKEAVNFALGNSTPISAWPRLLTGTPDPLSLKLHSRTDFAAEDEDVKELVETIISDSWSFPALRP